MYCFIRNYYAIRGPYHKGKPSRLIEIIKQCNIIIFICMCVRVLTVEIS